MANAHETMHELTEQGRRLRDRIPEVYAGYARLNGAAMADGAMPGVTKELIALAIAVARECDGCIAAHARNAAAKRATEAEVAEALGVAILMSGGPGTVWAPRAFAAFQEYAAAGPGSRAPEPAPHSHP